MVTRVTLNFVTRVTRSAIGGGAQSCVAFDTLLLHRWYRLCTLLTPVHLVRKAATEVRREMHVKLRLDDHLPQCDQGSDC